MPHPLRTCKGWGTLLPMSFRFRKRPRLGPLRFNVTERGLRSVSIKAGPFTWNPKRRRITTDLPGGLYHQHNYEEK